MRRSEIFDSFVKIAQEKGLVSKADHAEHTEKDFSETNPRHDSLTVEQIGKLYNNKHVTPKEMEYKKNIMEIAHPEQVVISPSYDKLNGLVENENEGQNIRLRIVNKEPDGHLTQRKYAQQQLVMSLVRVANDLDNRDQEKLCKLADVCLLQATGQALEKKAILPLLIIGAMAAVIGGIYAKNHLRFHSDGWTQDYQKATKEIDDLLNSDQNPILWGYKYTPEFTQTVTELKQNLAKLDEIVVKVLPMLTDLEKPRTRQELMQMAQQPQNQQLAQYMQEFQQVFAEVAPFIVTTINDFKNEGYKQRAIADKGWAEQGVDAVEVLHGGSGLVADDFDDVRHALETLEVDVKNIDDVLKTYQNAKKTAEDRLQAGAAQTTQTFSTPTSTAAEKPKGEAGQLDQAGEGFVQRLQNMWGK